MRCVLFFLSLLTLSLLSSPLYADEVWLINGDKLSGSITKDGKNKITLESDIYGVLTIEKKNIDHVVMPQKPSASASINDGIQIEWIREIDAGYSITTGNTETSNFSFSSHINRKSPWDEYTFKASIHQSSSQEKMDDQKWGVSGRYAYSFGQAKKWYHFFKLETNHDKFGGIDYRIIPSSGIGYWFSDNDPFKALSELALGYEYTEYNNDTEASEEVVLIPRLFAEWNIYGDTRLSEELFIYPSLTDLGEYRLSSETVFTNPINDHVALKLKYINDYNSNPPDNTKKHDMIFTSSLSCSF